MTRRLAPRHGFAAAIAAVAVAGLATWWFFSPRVAPSPATPTPQDAPAATAAQPGPDTQRPPSTRNGEPRRMDPASLPPPGTDPAQVVAALLPAADAGDTRAACRVAVELVGCQHAAGMVGHSVLRGERDGPFAAEVSAAQAEWDAGVAAHHARCLAIAPEIQARAAGLLRTAAHAGEADAALLYAQGTHLMQGTSRDFMAHPGFAQWRAEAEAMLWRSLRAGDARATFLIAIGSSGDFGLLDGLIDDDLVTARAMWLLRARLQARSSRHMQRTGEEELRAAELAARWHHEHFDDRILTEETLEIDALRPPMPWIAKHEPQRCTGPRLR